MEKRIKNIRAGELLPLINAYSDILDAAKDFRVKLRISAVIQRLSEKQEVLLKAVRSALKDIEDEGEQQDRLRELNDEEIEVEAMWFTEKNLSKFGDKIAGRTVYVLVWHDLIEQAEEDEPDADDTSP